MSKAIFSISGTWTALITPFTKGGAEVDYAALRQLVDSQVAAGITGLVPVGTTGESPTLSKTEHLEVLERVIEYAAGRVPVLAGCGSNSTDETILFTRHAQRFGAAGALLVTPYYNRPPTEGLRRHFHAVANAAPDFPLVAYEIPARTGASVPPALLSTLFNEIPAFCGVKDASHGTEYLEEIARLGLLEQGFQVVSGDDGRTNELIEKGACGLISVASNAAPRAVLAMVSAALAGNSSAECAKLAPLFAALGAEVNPIPIKTLLHLAGQCGGDFRLPLCPPSADNTQALREVLAFVEGASD